MTKDNSPGPLIMWVYLTRCKPATYLEKVEGVSLPEFCDRHTPKERHRVMVRREEEVQEALRAYPFVRSVVPASIVDPQ